VVGENGGEIDMSVRAARESDLDDVVRLLAESREGAGFDRADGPSGFVFPFERAYAERLFLRHLIDRRGCAIVHEVDGSAQGVLLAVRFEHPFGPVTLAMETLWWVTPAHRGRAAMRMLDAYEAWAKAHGCAYAAMFGMGSDPDVGALYLRRGYKAAERRYLKAL
jgi:GNAT superfamily N-acetyltransferase